MANNFEYTKLVISSKNQAPIEKDNSFATTVYNEIAAAIGGNNNNQFLCLQLPGTILYANDYKYDYESSAPKPLVVEANESRLANKMFDPCRIVSADNGFSLPYQYESALDTLSPKLNRNLANFKNKLRQLLLTEYPYDFGNGTENGYTMQQVYFKLYDDYIDCLSKWSQLKKNKKEELLKKSLSTEQYNNDYLEWYELESEKALNEINEKKSKILSVFSPNDMKILEGALDSGTGAELQETRQTLNGVRKRTPTGGYIYPVRFSPPYWFKMIGTSFTPTDLMKDAEALSTDLQDYTVRRMHLCAYIENMGSLLSSKEKNGAISKTIGNIKKYKKKMDESESVFIEFLYGNKKGSPVGEQFKKMLIPATELHSGISSEIQVRIITNLAKRANVAPPTTAKLNQLLKEKKSLIASIVGRRQNYINSVLNLKQLLEEKFKNTSNSSIKELLTPVITQLDTINEKISIIQEQMKFVSEQQLDELDEMTSKSIVPDGFTQVVIDTDIESLGEVSSYTSSHSASSKGLGFLFAGKGKATSFEEYCKQYFKQCQIKITMNVAKIGIERDWFNPGIFALTKNMIKLGSTQISPARDDYEGITEERLNDMSKCIFPCYPVAMVIARDISISFIFNSSFTSIAEQYKVIEKQALSGNGFLMFRNKAGNSSMQSSSSHVSMQNNVVTVKIDSTQLIGYHLEATRPDQSTSLETLTSQIRNGISNSASISEFAGNYKNMINDSTIKGKSNSTN